MPTVPDKYLPPDAEAEKRWHQLPQTTPSKDAMPPAVFGAGKAWLWWLLIIAAVVIIGILSQVPSGS